MNKAMRPQGCFMLHVCMPLGQGTWQHQQSDNQVLHASHYYSTTRSTKAHLQDAAIAAGQQQRLPGSHHLMRVSCAVRLRAR